MIQSVKQKQTVTVAVYKKLEIERLCDLAKKDITFIIFFCI